VNGVEKYDRKGNLAWVFSLNYPIMRQLGVKLAYIGMRAQESVGLDSDSIALGFSTFW